MPLKKRSLKNKKILITAGPTNVAIDPVRFISNTASGKTGILLANLASKNKAKVTLLLGSCVNHKLSKKVKLKKFFLFDELKNLLYKEIKNNNYDAVIHCAAVSDFKPRFKKKKKIDSINKYLTLHFESTEKLVNKIKILSKNIFLVAFKFEPQAQKSTLLNKAKALFKDAGADIVVANTIKNRKYAAFIIDKNLLEIASVSSKNRLTRKLISIIGEKIC